MRFMLIAARKDLRRRLADPAALLLWIGLPIVIGGLMLLIGGGGTPDVRARVLLVDRDNSLASRFVAGAGRQGQLSKFLEVIEVTPDEGQRRIDAGEASALLIIPKGFQDGVLKEQPTELTLITNPAQRILPRMLEEGLKLMAEAAFYLQRLFGGPIREMADGRGSIPTDEAVAAISRAINQNLRQLQGTLLPPVIRLEVKTEAARRPSFDVGAFFLPGLLFMSILFMANGMSLDIWIEKERGTLRRTMSTPQHLAWFVAGKLAASVVLTAAVVMAALAIGVLGLRAPLSRAPLALVWSCFAGAALFCYFMLIQVSASNARTAGVLSQLVVLPLMMIGGSFFPFEAMPEWMAAIGRWTPNGLAVTRVKEILFGQPSVASLALSAAAIGVPAALALLLSVRRLRGSFLTS